MTTKYKCTFVTALFNINREIYDGRTVDDYKVWLKKTLQLEEPIVIFCDSAIEDLEQMVRECRKSIDSPTIIVDSFLEDIPCFWMLEKATEILSNEKSFVRKYPSDICNRNPLYICIQYSKFEWMLSSSRMITWETDFFAWIDAGISRFYKPGMRKFNTGIIPLTVMPTSFFLLHKSPSTDGFLSSHCHFDKEKYIGTNECHARGTIFFATIDRLEWFITKMYDFIKKDLFENNRSDNEQIAIAVIAKENPGFFNWLNCDENHLRGDIFVT